LTEVTTDCY